MLDGLRSYFAADKGESTVIRDCRRLWIIFSI
jgi:hypothetical protein